MVPRLIHSPVLASYRRRFRKRERPKIDHDRVLWAVIRLACSIEYLGLQRLLQRSGLIRKAVPGRYR